MLNNQSLPTIALVATAILSTYPRRARRHSLKKLKKMVKSIQAMGLIVPVIADENFVILSGHLRVEAFEYLGFEEISCIQVCGLTEEQKSAFVIASNKMAEEGTWDEDVLRQEFEILSSMNCDFDLDITGFELPEIDLILQTDDFTSQEEPEVPAPPDVANTRKGDLIRLGDHLLYCGDSLDDASWRALLGSELAAMCFADPPYNVPNKGHVTSKDHADFAMAYGEMSPDEYIAFLNTAFSLAVRYSRDGALHYICIDHRHLREIYSACDEIYSEQLNLIVWSKTNAGMGSFYRSGHELIPIFKVGAAKHINNVQLGRFGRNRSNVWTYPGANTFRRDRDKDLADHPTVKPVAMVADAILDATHRGDIVLDCFGGSGTLILAAEHTDRRARVIEYEPRYCDVAIRRWEEMTGQKAMLIGSGGVLALPAPPKLLPAPKQGGSHE